MLLDNNTPRRRPTKGATPSTPTPQAETPATHSKENTAITPTNIYTVNRAAVLAFMAENGLKAAVEEHDGKYDILVRDSKGRQFGRKVTLNFNPTSKDKRIFEVVRIVLSARPGIIGGTPCDRCRTTGRYADLGKCQTCNGKGWQSPADVERNKEYRRSAGERSLILDLAAIDETFEKALKLGLYYGVWARNTRSPEKEVWLDLQAKVLTEIGLCTEQLELVRPEYIKEAQEAYRLRRAQLQGEKPAESKPADSVDAQRPLSGGRRRQSDLASLNN